MNRRATFAMTTTASDFPAQQKSLKEQMVGTWTLVSSDQVRPDGSKLNEFRANPTGINVFDAAEEEHILRCLGAALIMESNTLPTGLQRDLFDHAGSMGELLDTATLRGQIARFLRKRTDGEDEIGRSLAQS